MNKHFIPQSIYLEIIKHVPILCVDVAVRYNGKLLLVKRKHPPFQDEWWTLGGRVHNREKLADAAVRKLKEETNLTSTQLTLIGPYETIFDEEACVFDGGVHASHTVNILFIAAVEDISMLKLDLSSSEYKLFDNIEMNWNPLLKRMITESKLFDWSI